MRPYGRTLALRRSIGGRIAQPDERALKRLRPLFFLSEAFPQQLAGLLAALAAMVAGSLMPQFVADHRGHIHHYEGTSTRRYRA